MISTGYPDVVMLYRQIAEKEKAPVAGAFF